MAFDFNTPLSNKILTNGFSIFIRTVGSPPRDFSRDLIEKDVRLAFQYAMTLWTSGLSDHDSLVSDRIRAFVSTRTSKSSGGYTLFTPPQVIQAGCEQSASFIVELSFGKSPLFPVFPLTLAKGRIEGRTIALNMNVGNCHKSEFILNAEKQLSFQLADGCLNLIPIITHELGHAFGIRHIESSVGIALMNSAFSRTALMPNVRDIQALVKALEASIEGARPGVLEFVASGGIRPPIDWIPNR